MANAPQQKPISSQGCGMANRTNALDPLVDRLSTIGTKAQQLEAVLNLCYGGGFEHFSCMSECLQDAALELAADLAGQINRISCGAENA
jgi:predicted methyltransferase